MTKQTSPKPHGHSWSVYFIKGTPAKFLGIINDAPDERTAVMLAIKKHKVPLNRRDRLAARRRD